MEFEAVVARLRKMMIDRPSSDEYLTATGNFGFTSGNNIAKASNCKKASKYDY
jgi:hypothetical protein